MQVRWSHRERRDLFDIGEYIAADDSTAAHRWVERLLDRAVLVASAPNAGRLVPELRRPDVREVFVKTYRLVHRVHAHEIVVLTVFEGHRRFPSAIDLDS